MPTERWTKTLEDQFKHDQGPDQKDRRPRRKEREVVIQRNPLIPGSRPVVMSPQTWAMALRLTEEKGFVGRTFDAHGGQTKPTDTKAFGKALGAALAPLLALQALCLEGRCLRAQTKAKEE